MINMIWRFLRPPNTFNADPNVTPELKQFAEMISRFKIPVYILGRGLQCAAMQLKSFWTK